MNKNLKNICLLILFALLYLGCEKVNEVEIELPNKIKLVVQAELKCDEIFTGVRILRSMELNSVYSIDSSEIKGAIAYLRIDDIQIVPLHYREAGLYYPYQDLIIQPGRTYELFVETDETTAYSKTKVPFPPEIIEAKLHDDYYIYASLPPNPDEAYGALWAINSGTFEYKAENFFSVEIPEAKKTFILRTVIMPEKYQSTIYANRTYIRVYAFDKAYYYYFLSKDNNKPIDNNFIQSGGSVNWNVFGENVIGIFIGYAESELTKASKNP